MPDPTRPPQPPVRTLRALGSLLPFLRRRPGWVALAVGLLLVNIAIELSLPQILGRTITALSSDDTRAFSLPHAVGLFLTLVVVRAAVGMVLGPIRNQTVQRTLGDIR